MADSKRKALLKPFQLIGISAIFGIFVLLVFLLTIQDWVLGLIAGGATFIVSIVVLAMLVLSYRPNAEVPVYLDRFQADSDEPGAAEAALKVDPDAALSGTPTTLGEQSTAERPRTSGRGRTTDGDTRADRDSGDEKPPRH